jgi:RNA polymerase sigma factor (TIGR02999 family)
MSTSLPPDPTPEDAPRAEPLAPPPAPRDDAREIELAALLEAASRGDRGALDAAFAHVYDDLRRLAARVRVGRASDTMSATALVHEAYVKLARPGDAAAPRWEGRRHFFAVAARAMRQVLVGAARERLAGKRGGGEIAVTFDERAHAEPVRPAELIALDEALERLAAVDPRAARVVECRYFAGLTAEETAEALDISTPTVQRDWRAARAWLARELQASGEAGDAHDADG